MKLSLLILAGAGIITLGFVSKNKLRNNLNEPSNLPGSYAPVVVLELFTSQGCSSCPPADELLPKLANLDSNIIPLSFHVDYWNRLGWTDPFSNSEYSDRQRRYADFWKLESVYTPELVINGVYEVVGSNKYAAESSIKKALKDKSKVMISIEDVIINEGKINFTCKNEGDWKKNELIAVLVQKNATMKIKAGENRGATLSHINIVRSFYKEPAENKNKFSLKFPKDLTDKEWLLVVYSQQTNDLKITGAVQYDLSYN